MRPRGGHRRLAQARPSVSDLEAIAALYQRVDNSLEDLRDRCDAAGEAEERDRLARRRRLNEQACFAPAWGQLEAEIGGRPAGMPSARGNRTRTGDIAGREEAEYRLGLLPLRRLASA